MAEKKLMEKVLHQVVRTFPKVNMPLTRRLCRAIIVAIRNYQLSFCEDSL